MAGVTFEAVSKQFDETRAVESVSLEIADACNLERNLYPTTQTADTRVPLLVALNMFGVAANKGMELPADPLACCQGCSVVADRRIERGRHRRARCCDPETL